MPSDPTLSLQATALIAGASGLGGALIGGLVTLRATRNQIDADVKHHWQELGANAYAATLAVASEFSLSMAHATAAHHVDTGEAPASYAVTRGRASEALGDLERTTVLSDNPEVRAAAEKLSAMLRNLDFTWGRLVGWQERVLTNPAGSTPHDSARALVTKHTDELDELLRSLYGPSGEGGGALDAFRDALRRTRGKS